jgi:hypothetical protein
MSQQERLKELVESFTIDKIEEKKYNNTTFLRYYATENKIVPAIEAASMSVTKLRNRIRKFDTESNQSAKKQKRAVEVSSESVQTLSELNITIIISGILTIMKQKGYNPHELTSKSGSFNNKEIGEFYETLSSKCNLEPKLFFIITDAGNHPRFQNNEDAFFFGSDGVVFFREEISSLIVVLNSFMNFFFPETIKENNHPYRAWIRAIKGQYELYKYYSE